MAEDEDTLSGDEEVKPGEGPQDWADRMDDQEADIEEQRETTSKKPLRRVKIDEYWDPHLGNL